MSDKITAGLVTFAAILPLCAVCVLGPAAIWSILAGLIAWLGGFALVPAMLAAAGGAALVYLLARWRRRSREPE
jgi:membrane protein DedA with SNARE-associated domain